jgi:hypothetical protein
LEVDTGATDLTLYQSFVEFHQLLVPTEQKILAPVAGIGGTAGTVMTTRMGDHWMRCVVIYREVRGYNLTVRRGAKTLSLRLNLRKLIQ